MPQNRVKMLLQKLAAVFILLYNIKVVEVSGENGISIAFAIDDTRSMYNVIDAVKTEAKKILDEALAKKPQDVKDLVLVTINDPDATLRTNTSSKSEFLEHLNNIRAHNYINRDCEEMSMTGIYEALLNSRPGSYVFVFTDASAKDYLKVEAVKNLAQRKQIQVIFILTGDCGSTRHRGYKVYRDIAKATSGQSFRLRVSEINSILNAIRELLHDLKTVTLWKELYMDTFFYERKEVTFTVDEKTDNVVITTNGNVNYLQITRDNMRQVGFTPITWTSNVKVVKLANPRPGTYNIIIEGSGHVSIVIYATTDFTFEHGFSTQKPTSLERTSKQPTNRGTPQHLCINITDPDNAVNIQNVQLLDMDGREITKLPLDTIGPHFYMTKSFVAPTDMFNIKVTGEVKTSGKEISRVSKTPVKPPPRLPHIKPEVNIKEGSQLQVKYGTGITLTCNVKAYPEPEIVWTNSKGDKLPSQNSEVDAPAYISYLTLNNLDKSDTYVCKASNNLGTGEAHTAVLVRPLFTTISSPPAVKNVKYGERVTLRCDIRSDDPMEIRWLNSENKNIENNLHHIKLSADKTLLTLESVDLATQGTYICEGYLTAELDKKISYKTDVKIVGLKAPQIQKSQTKYFAVTGDEVLRIPCYPTGYPDPVVTWKKDGETIKTNKYEIKDNHLIILDPVATNTTNYTCEATNVLGFAKQKYEIIVFENVGNHSVVQGKINNIIVKLNASLTIKCNVSNSNKLPVRWYLNGQRTNHTGSSYVIKNAADDHYGIYTCRVNTNLGSYSHSYNVGFPPYFVNSEYFPEDWNGNEEWLDCAVNAIPEAEVSWYLNGIQLPIKNNYTQEYLVQNYGEYKCVVGNPFGSIQRTFKIASSDCFINEHMATQNMPLWLNEDTTTWPQQSSSAGILVKADESIKLICASNGATPNTFHEFPTNTTITAKCYKENKFVVEEKVYDFSKLQCKTKVEPLIVNTQKECFGPHTEIIQVGFRVDSFLEAYKICYDTKNNVPLFGSSPIIIEDIGNEQSLFNWSPSSSVGGGNPIGGFNCQNAANCCYNKSQLVTVDEVVFGPAQAATLKDNLNSVAVWIPCESEHEEISWNLFEKKVADWSQNCEFKSWTGASEYRNQNGGLVPRYLWKVIKNEVYTVVVYENDPKPNPSSNTGCSKVCNTLKMPQLETDLNNSKSFYCCSLEEFSNVFGIPSKNFETTSE